MKNLLCIAALLLSLVHAASGQTYPPLVVHQGEIQTLAPQTYIYSSVTVEKGGTLVIASNSAAWTIIFSKGDVSVKGTIVAHNFKSGPNNYTAITPDGEQLSNTFSETNLAGAGGHGGISACTYNGGGGNVFAPGGNGAPGTQSSGGGGGAGGVYTGKLHCQDQPIKGNDASGSAGGAQQAGQSSTHGGDGSSRGPYMNGGLLYLYCGGNFDGESGLIDASGNQGANGAAGGNNTMNPSLFGGGGGGGGAPGGEGGEVILKVKGSSGLYPTVLVSGGNGGAGGMGGTGFANYSTVPPSAGGNGGAGISGQNGKVSIEH